MPQVKSNIRNVKTNLRIYILESAKIVNDFLQDNHNFTSRDVADSTTPPIRHMDTFAVTNNLNYEKNYFDRYGIAGIMHAGPFTECDYD